MTEIEKSRKLAELMGWKVMVSTMGTKPKHMVNMGSSEWYTLRPYNSDHWGLAQFAAILLKYPHVFEYAKGGGYINGKEPTQENILDEVLRINGIDIGQKQRDIL